jgi:general secretion pathway protein G
MNGLLRGRRFAARVRRITSTRRTSFNCQTTRSNHQITRSNHQITRSPDHQIPSTEAGFTLIELMVVISLIVILSSLGLVQYRHSIVYSQEAVLRDDLNKMRDAIDQYYADKNAYPESLDALVSDGYLRALPKDPFTRSETTWTTVPSEPDPANPTAAPGVYDVKSGSDASAVDGSKYSDW